MRSGTELVHISKFASPRNLYESDQPLQKIALDIRHIFASVLWHRLRQKFGYRHPRTLMIMIIM